MNLGTPIVGAWVCMAAAIIGAGGVGFLAEGVQDGEPRSAFLGLVLLAMALLAIPVVRLQ